MAKIDTAFTGSIPSLYDEYLGPLIFRPYAEDLAGRLLALNPDRVLETAAGTGIVTREMLRALPAKTTIVATDLNQPMLDHAAAQVSSDRVSWQKADAQALPFPDRSFDAVVCQFGAMFFPDRQKAYREARRVLKPGGHFIFSVWDTLETNEFTNVVHETLAACFPNDPPDFIARTPHGYHDRQAVVADARGAGFANVSAETVTRRSRAPSGREPAIGFCQGTPLRNEIEARGADRLNDVTDAAAARITAAFGTGPIEGKIQAHVITASDGPA